MRALNQVKEAVIEFVSAIASDWWVEVTTDKPRCRYYFGPFTDFVEARTAHFGYVEDLVSEDAKGIAVKIKRCKPEQLTVFDLDAEI